MPGALMLALLLGGGSRVLGSSDASQTSASWSRCSEDVPVRLVTLGRRDGSLAVGSRSGTEWLVARDRADLSRRSAQAG